MLLRTAAKRTGPLASSDPDKVEAGRASVSVMHGRRRGSCSAHTWSRSTPEGHRQSEHTAYVAGGLWQSGYSGSWRGQNEIRAWDLASPPILRDHSSYGNGTTTHVGSHRKVDLVITCDTG